MQEITFIIQALGLAVVLTGVGELFGARLPLLRKVALPGAVLGGLLGLGLSAVELPATKDVFNVLGEFPVLFINVVFACLLLGKRVDGFSKVWQRARPHVIIGHVTAWGQYVVGLALVLFILMPFTGINELAGPTIAIGFQGGHGTAAGLAANFQALDFPEGKTIAYAIATLGIVFGTIGGPLLANLLSRRHPVDPPEAGTSDASEGPEPENFSVLTGKLTMHLALIAVVIALAWLLLQSFQWFEKALRGGDATTYFTQYIPLFSVVLISGFAAQLILQSFDGDRFFDRQLFNTISSFGLDMVIVGALATLSLSVMKEYWVAITVLALGGLLWNLAVFFLLGPRLFPKPWYPYALGDLGGGTATTASGLLLIRVADPDQRTHARQSYSEKQPFYEPIMGGGLVTAMALPLVAILGAWSCLLITAVILSLWIAYGLIRASKG